MSKAITEQANFMVPGSTGSGKTIFCAQMVQVLLSGQRSDIPASRPAPATEAVKTADNKKEDNRE